MANVLVVGGAGYVGSALCARLTDNGHRFTVLDDLSTGHREMVIGANFVQARAGDSIAVKQILRRERFDCVMHFAARSLISECFEKRDDYFENNVEQTRLLMQTLLEFDVRRFVFSSTCAVYGIPQTISAIDESMPTCPINPYGESKLMAEGVLSELATSSRLQAISLRYFNAAGAETGMRVGEWHEPESHLIPLVLRAALNGTELSLNGTDYPTPDGTCIRDYIHVSDLAQAHEAAMHRLLAMSPTAGSHERYNLGSECGFSIREVIAAVEEVVGHKIKVVERPRREGDPAQLVGSTRAAKTQLGFRPQHSDLKSIISTALAWEKKRRDVYERQLSR